MVWIPLYFPKAGRASVARLTVGEEGSEYNCPEVKGAIRNALLAVNGLLARGVERWEPVQGRDFSVKIELITGKEIRGRMLGGNSLALAVAMAICSWVSRQKIPKDVLITGNIGEDGSPLCVGRIEAKLCAGERMIPGFRKMVYPKDGTPLEGIGRKAVAVASLAEAVRSVFGRAVAPRVESSVMNLRGAVDSMKSEYRRQVYDFVIDLGERILPVLHAKSRDYPKERWEAMVHLAAAYGHVGDTEKALFLFGSAGKIGARLRKEGRINPVEHANATNLSVSPLRDRFRFVEAEKKLRACRAEISPESDRGLFGKINGQIGNLLLDVGRYEEAVPFLEESIRMIQPFDRARNYCYLGQAFCGIGDRAAAEKSFCKSEEENMREGDPVARFGSLKFLYARWAALRIEIGDLRGAQEFLDKGVFALRAGKKKIGSCWSEWPGLLYLLEAFRGELTIDGKAVRLDRILRAGDASGSPILRLLSRVACLDALHHSLQGRRMSGYGGTLPDLAGKFLTEVENTPGASAWFRAERKVLERFALNPHRHRYAVLLACKQVRRRMPNL